MMDQLERTLVNVHEIEKVEPAPGGGTIVHLADGRVKWVDMDYDTSLEHIEILRGWL